MLSKRVIAAWAAAAVLPATLAAAPVQAADAPAAASCDRACLTGLANVLLDSMPAHAPASLPLTPVYAATENSTPAAVTMMAMWRTATAIKSRYFAVDEVTGQVFFVATVAEGSVDAIAYGRMKAEGDKISEIELFVNRSRGQGGFQFGPEGPAGLPDAWTRPLTTERRSTREELLLAGRSIFDTSLPSPPASPACELIENGRTVEEHPEVLDAISGQPGLAAKQRQLGNGMVAVPCPNPPDRPTDPKARTTIVDTEQGVVVSFAIVHGVTPPYVMTEPTESAFVPDQMFPPYSVFMREQIRNRTSNSPYIREMRSTGAVSQAVRIYDGEIQGIQLMVNLGAPDGTSPWVE